MKKSLQVLLIVLSICVAFSACGKKSAEFSFSDGLDENGYFKGIKALDYVTIPENLDKIELQKDEIEAFYDQLTSEYFPDEVECYDRAVKDDDLFYMDFVGYVDGQALESMAGTNQAGDLLNDTYIPGFLSQIVGHYPGQTFKIDVTFPDPYEANTELSGKDAVFEITLNYVVDFVPATMDDDFVATNLYYYYGVSTVEELDAYMTEMLLESYIVDNSSVSEVPESIMTWVQNCAVKSNQLYAANYYQVEEAEYLQNAYGVSTEEEFLESYADELKEQAEQYLLIVALCENEGLKLTEADVKASFEESGQSEYYDEYIEMYGLSYCKQMVMEDKIINELLSRVVLK